MRCLQGSQTATPTRPPRFRPLCTRSIRRLPSGFVPPRPTAARHRVAETNTHHRPTPVAAQCDHADAHRPVRRRTRDRSHGPLPHRDRRRQRCHRGCRIFQITTRPGDRVVPEASRVEGTGGDSQRAARPGDPRGASPATSSAATPARPRRSGTVSPRRSPSPAAACRPPWHPRCGRRTRSSR
jgi:hypothetical protein